MKECRFTKQDILNLPSDNALAKFIMKQMLRSEGIDVDGNVTIYEDYEKDEYVYKQE